jgi:hypothetical protein
MDRKSGYDFRIQRAEIDKEDIKYFKQWKHCWPVLSLSEETVTYVFFS